MKVLVVDQWSSTASNPGIPKIPWSQWEKDPQETFQNLRGGDSEAAKRIFGGTLYFKEVDDTECPSLGTVWYICNENGFPNLWKTNYDSSD